MWIKAVVFHLLWKWMDYRLVPFVSNLLPFRVAPFQKEFGVQDSKQDVTKVFSFVNMAQNIVEPRYLELAYFELPLISKWKSGPCFNMKLWQQVTK